MRIAILDDYQQAALKMADWSVLSDRAEIEVFSDTLTDPDALVERLAPFEVLSVMRERTPLPRSILERLKNLKLIVSTGPRNASIDTTAAAEFGIDIAHTGYASTAAIELTWALILSSARNLVDEATSLRSGGWQTSVGDDLSGQTLALLGLGSIGSTVARIGIAFGMKLIAWSPNLTPERAEEVGAELVTKEELFARADILTIHMVLSPKTKGLVDAEAFRAMKPSAKLINTSRGPLVDEAALLEALLTKRIAGAAIDVFDIEPLPADHPLRTIGTVLATPHIGYVTRKQYETFFRDTVHHIDEWLSLRKSAVRS